ncbi:diphthine synthase [Candidatus Micrarchaeota archaeon]|nr:diphthine synthase [Candidatus Micrarchaeota archaeon]
MPLFLIGSGVSFDLTLEGIRLLKECDEVFIETYTNPIEQTKIKALERLIGKPIVLLERTHLESSYLVNKAKSSKIGIIASGDPLTATTHITLVIEAKQKGVLVKVIHNSSIYSVAPARSGLQIYRFGKTASLVNPRENYKPTSSLDIIRENLSRNLHTLVLLDTEPKPMEALAALQMLKEFDSLCSGFVVLSRAGCDDEKIVYGKISELIKQSEIKNEKIDLGKPPFAIIVPAKLHPIEEEHLNQM